MRVRVGVIGAGAVADITHLPAYHETPEARSLYHQTSFKGAFIINGFKN
jgi:predicted dehydrogenase